MIIICTPIPITINPAKVAPAFFKDPVTVFTKSVVTSVKEIYETKKNSKILNVVEQKKEKSQLVLDLDSILDKISEFGMNSLTKLEKKFLDDLSKS